LKQFEVFSTDLTVEKCRRGFVFHGFILRLFSTVHASAELIPAKIYNYDYVRQKYVQNSCG